MGFEATVAGSHRIPTVQISHAPSQKIWCYKSQLDGWSAGKCGGMRQAKATMTIYNNFCHSYNPPIKYTLFNPNNILFYNISSPTGSHYLLGLKRWTVAVFCEWALILLAAFNILRWSGKVSWEIIELEIFRCYIGARNSFINAWLGKSRLFKVNVVEQKFTSSLNLHLLDF